MPKPIPPLADRVITSYQSAFGSLPTHLARAPGRVTLLGDHTDYAGGLALASALDRECLAAIGPSQTSPPHSLEIYAIDLDERCTVPLDPDHLLPRAPTLPSWARYVGGTAALVHRAISQAGHSGLHVSQGLCLSFASSLPIGGGLSSSAALEIATATALEALVGQGLEPAARARLAQQAEHEFAGSPCGLLDQLIAIHAEPGHALRLDFRANTAQQIPLPQSAAARFILLNSNQAHENAAGAYAERRAWCQRAQLLLELDALTQLTEPELPAAERILDETAARAARHVITENARVEQYITQLAANNWAEAGHTMNASHHSLSETYRVSTPRVDALAEAIRRLPGVHGCRMTGGGFGGHLIALTQTNVGPTQLSLAAQDVTGEQHDSLAVHPSAGATSYAVP